MGDWQWSVHELSECLARRPDGSEIGWIDSCRIAQAKCERTLHAFQAHRNFHGC